MNFLMTTLLLLLRITALRSHRPVLRTFTSTNTNNLKYHIRRASVDDIFKINQCNLDNLRENYSYQFYHNHILRCPELSLIAETDRYEMVGYALGNIEVLPFALEDSLYCGHLVSVAVNSNYRGNGVARHLLDTLHREMVAHYNVNSVSLFCRKAFEYQIDKTIPEYYSDKEDAYIMTAKGLKAKYGNSILEESSTVHTVDVK